MANNLGVTTGSDATIKTTDNAGVHTTHHNIEVAGSAPALNAGAAGATVLRTVSATDSPEVTSLAIMDDWDESDRAKVNIIAGQAGVDAGFGTGGSKTPRVIIDSSQVAAAVTASHVIGDGSQKVTLPTDVAVPVKPLSASYSASAAFTPAAASHVAGDCNGAAAEIDFNATSASRIMITSAEFIIADGTVKATSWTLHLYNVTPPSATADDGAWDLASGDRASYLGAIELGTAVDKGSTQYVETHGINKQIKLSGDSVFAYLVNNTTVTPANVAHTVTLHAVAL